MLARVPFGEVKRFGYRAIEALRTDREEEEQQEESHGEGKLAPFGERPGRAGG
jgi:hypothetical protein